MNLSIVLSHTFDELFLSQCLSILDRIEILKKIPIHIDGYNSGGLKAASKVEHDRVVSKDTHNDCHGGRCFDILNKIETDYVIIMDSDFLCTDENFWIRVINSLETHEIVSIGRRWHSDIILPTTPFVAYNRKAVIQAVPERKLWNIFTREWPHLKYPIFDNLQFIFLSYYLNRKDKIDLLDLWLDYKDRKFKFFHFWDSRHPYEHNFTEFDNHDIPKNIRYEYLSYGVTKCFFHCILENKELPDCIWAYVEFIKDYKEKKIPFNHLEDFAINFKNQLIYDTNSYNRVCEISKTILGILYE